MGYPHKTQQKNKQNGNNNQIISCSNPSCNSTSKNQNIELMKLFDSFEPYCMQCRESIAMNWVCYYCNTIFREQNIDDVSEWVGCDNSKCSRWTHIDCEAQKGVIQIKQMIKNKSSNYFCPVCRNTKPKGTKQFSLKNKEKLPNSFELKKFMISKRKKQHVNYYYLYSDTYKPIEKLLNNNNNMSLKLDGDELTHDLAVFNKVAKKEIFNLNNLKGRRVRQANQLNI